MKHEQPFRPGWDMNPQSKRLQPVTLSAHESKVNYSVNKDKVKYAVKHRMEICGSKSQEQGTVQS